MRTRRAILALATIAVCASCSSSLDSLPTGDIVGRWTADREEASPAGSYVRHITFTNDGHFVSEFRSYGIYPTERAEDLSGYQRTVGTFTVAGDELSFQPDSLISWDAFYGTDSPVTVQTPYPYDSVYDDAHYRIDGVTLTLDFTTYPADGPEPTSLMLRRDR